MESIKQITIEDNGVNKTFEIRKMTAWNQFLYTNKIISLIADTDKINSTVIAELINRITKTGVSNSGVDDTQISSVLAGGGVSLAFDVILSIFADLDEYKQVQLLTPLVSCIQALNPMHIQMDLIEGSDKNINLFVFDFINLYKLAYAVLELNYGRFFQNASSLNS